MTEASRSKEGAGSRLCPFPFSLLNACLAFYSAGKVEGGYYPPRLAKLVIGMTSLISSLGNKLNAWGIKRLSHLR